MSVEELFSELRKLKRADKLRAMQLLVWDLAVEEEALLRPDAQYEVWSPFDSWIQKTSSFSGYHSRKQRVTWYSLIRSSSSKVEAPVPVAKHRWSPADIATTGGQWSPSV